MSGDHKPGRYSRDIKYRDATLKCSNKKHTRDRKCAKILCPTMLPEKIVSLVCPVCHIKFGVVAHDYDAQLKRRGYPPTYCSKTCSGISRSKKYREASDYSKRIKALQKVK